MRVVSQPNARFFHSWVLKIIPGGKRTRIFIRWNFPAPQSYISRCEYH
jgi:hypothetical protein